MSKTTVLQVKNLTGRALIANTAVYITGTTDDTDALPTIDVASMDSPETMPACGLLRDNLDVNATGLVKITGKLVLDTSQAATVNAPVFVGLNGQVIFQNPSDFDVNATVQQVGTVSKIGDQTSGQIYLFPVELQRKHAPTHAPNKWDQFLHAIQHEVGGGDEINHGNLANLKDDTHPQYVLADGTRSFTAPVAGVDPSNPTHLATKEYVDGAGFPISSPSTNTATNIAFYSAAQAITGSANLTYDSGSNLLTANSSVVVGTPTGGAKGVGTINATSVYDDNVLLTCYVPEFVAEGSIDLEKWDQTILAPEKAHLAAHRFSKNAKEELDPKLYAEKWLENGHLPAMPSTKEWNEAGKLDMGRIIQGLWETVEVLAEHIRQLNNRLIEIEGDNNE